jgi:hypothetical protein
MEFLRYSGPFRAKVIGVVIRPASNSRLSPLNSLERAIGARWRTHES